MKHGLSVAGGAVGILHINSQWPLPVGNAQNAATYPFPVFYEEVALDDPHRLLEGDPALVDPIVTACRRLVRKGVRIIVGACGSFAYFQKAVTKEIKTPVYLSVLVQVPFILQGLGRKKLGVIAASSTSMNKRLYEACDIHNPEQLVISDMQSSEEFKRMIACNGPLDMDRLCDDVCSVAKTLIETEPEISGLLLQCSDLPPFAGEVQRRFDLPVYDAISLVHWAEFCANQPGYSRFFINDHNRRRYI